MSTNDPSAAPSPRALRQRLESLRAAGVDFLPRKTPRPAPKASAAIAAPASASPPPAPVAPSPAAPRAASPALIGSLLGPDEASVSSAPTLEVLRAEVAACYLCEELAGTRTQTVFGVGASDARLCFMGEAPGADEDRLGEPFVGRAGQLLDRMLAACGLAREEVYILNVLKCRPPGNRNPAPEESQNCRRHLRRQLDLIAPEFICCLGAVAAQNYLETTTPIGRLRGRVHEHDGRRVVCTYHPAYLLRNPSAKKAAWDDLKLLMRELGVEL